MEMSVMNYLCIVNVKDHMGILDRLNRFISSCSGVQTLNELAVKVEQALDDLMEIEFSELYFYDFHESRLKLLVAKGFNDDERLIAERSAMERHPGNVFRTKTILNIPDTENDRDQRSVSFSNSVLVRSCVYVPVMNGEQAVGAFGILSSKKNQFNNEALTILSFIFNIAGSIYGNILMQAELRLTSLIARETDNAVIITGSDGLAEWVNQSFERISGYTLGNIKGIIPGKLLQGRETDPLIVKEIETAINKRESIETDLLNYHKDGHPYWVRLQIQPVFNTNGELTNFISIQRDVTEQKKVRTDLVKAIKEADAANAAKSLFLAKMSHEIRTPLNAVIGLSKLMRGTPLTPDQKNLNDKLILSGENLLGTINKILDFSKIEAGKIELESLPFDLRDVMKRVNSVLEHSAEEKKLTLTTRVSPQIPFALIGDPARLQQILTNLVSNAINFTTTGKVEISCELISATLTNAGLRFSVADTGIGISKENLKHVFENFRQEDESVNRLYGGTGLGLAISQQLVNLMGGELKVESVKGKGSRFYFFLQFQITDAQELQKVRRTIFFDQHILNNIRILVVEDNEFNQFIAISILEKWGASVDVAENGQIAVTKLWLSDYDLVLMDMQMPVMDGLTAARMIRADLNKETPIIALTADVTREALQKANQAGMNGYISKPFDEEDFYIKVLKTVGKEPAFVIENANPEPSGTVKKKEEMYYDLTKLSRSMLSDSIQIRNMLMKFNEFIPDYYNSLLKAYEKKEYAELHAAAHKIQSSIDLLAAKSVRDIVREIHAFSTAGSDHEVLEKLFERLNGIFPVMISQVQELIKEIPNDTTTGQ